MTLDSMPFYDVHHCVSLTKEERDRLAEAITFIHTRTFAVPRLFVNVQFTDLRNYHTYVAGKEVRNLSSHGKKHTKS